VRISFSVSYIFVGTSDLNFSLRISFEYWTGIGSKNELEGWAKGGFRKEDVILRMLVRATSVSTFSNN